MAGRHRTVAPNRPLSREVGRVGALLLLTTAPLVQVGAASADGSWGPSQERRAQTEDSDRQSGSRNSGDRDAGDRGSADGRDTDGDRRTGTRNASTRQRNDSRNDAADGRGYQGRHRATDAADDDDDDDDRGSVRTRGASRTGDNRPTRNTRTRATETTDDGRRPTGRSQTRTVQTAEGSTTTRRTRTQQSSASGGVPESRWDRLAQCESKERWSANTGNGYRGGLQFSDATWKAYGGGRYAPSAHQASREEQIEVASKVQREQGWSAWPACSRKLGYT